MFLSSFGCDAVVCSRIQRVYAGKLVRFICFTLLYVKDISSSYKKKARHLHPDKNPHPRAEDVCAFIYIYRHLLHAYTHTYILDKEVTKKSMVALVLFHRPRT